ncbi:hypothetical protein FW778_17370 [Ginsengibacter hankyongi]|uniref:DNA-binding protein n=1 Tax=Ginsengibacter hankyongi TaxID=2607284 RepID=A0A5J5IF26_9BACT|nr:hypothetical protein [Ginsengibacter hankyongi]KAA9037197.1 hypothetical protein FW778_17370 [Ginsengibacter hankyongi]
MKNILIIVFCLSAFGSYAQKEIKVEDAKNHVGETVRICTKIFGGKFFERDTLTLLNAGAYYPNAPLTIVIRARARKEFNKPEEYYKGAEVCVTGKIEMFKNIPQIEVTSKTQLVENLKDHTNEEPK